MGRAIVISVLIHLFILLSLLEPTISPAGGQQRANGNSPLLVSFNSLREIDKRNATLREGAMVLATVQPTHPNIALPPAMLSRYREKTARQERSEPGTSVRGELTENFVALAADVESQYRIDLARAARRSPYYPAALVAKGQQGVVRMSILYRGMLGAPNVVLEQSSGYRELDQEALKTLALAVSTVSLPAGAQGFHFRMQYALEYNLAD